MISFSNPDYFNVISWNEDGTGLVLKQQREFTETILPLYFRHRNFLSFIRQLNTYGFTKVGKTHHVMYFSHPQFYRGCENTLKAIHRKISKIEQDCNDTNLDNLKESIENMTQRIYKLEEHKKLCDNIRMECDKLRYSVCVIIGQEIKN